MIRKILPLAACIVIASTSRAQVYVGPDDENVTRPRKVSPELLDALSKTTTVVFIPNAEADLAADLAAKLKKVWTLSPVEVHPISDRDGLGLKFYEPSGYSTAQLHEETYAMVREGAHGARDLGHTSYFTFRIVNRVPKKDWSTDQLYAEVQVHANAMTSMLAAHGSDDQQPDPYAPGNIADFGAGFSTSGCTV